MFALIAAMVADGVFWCLQRILYDWVNLMPPMPGALVVLLGLPSLVTVSVFGMRRLGRHARRWGFMGYTPAFLFVVGFFCMLIRSFAVGKSAMDIPVRDTYFVFAGGQVEKGIAFLSGFFAAVYYYFPRFTRRPLHRGLGYWHFWLSVVGIFLFFNAAVVFLDEFKESFPWRKLSDNVWIESQRLADLALLLLLPGQVVFLINLVYSGVWGRKAFNL
ncbi:MAG TPA: cbb3-type cytochrome c oxidase subunit I [Puia sp.]|uniref:cbb3-type cytochrome c oxidase subunit I n=1 Tax=Puia sp. TaxID=2045100 RepID=UPI002C1BEE2A|nr:cbb3-type cytochrome c oxidase subunit I [Puia sp.]HVU95989.1 cbb3-type cytochrome c oxidase subunit I [Puia sp.]